MTSDLWYVSGPYTHSKLFKRILNIYRAWKWTGKLLASGYNVISPILNTAFQEYGAKISYEHYMKNDLEILRYCKGIFMLPGWTGSCGAKREYWMARKLGLEIIDLNNEQITNIK